MCGGPWSPAGPPPMITKRTAIADRGYLAGRTDRTCRKPRVTTASTHVPECSAGTTSLAHRPGRDRVPGARVDGDVATLRHPRPSAALNSNPARSRQRTILADHPAVAARRGRQAPCTPRCRTRRGAGPDRGHDRPGPVQPGREVLVVGVGHRSHAATQTERRSRRRTPPITPATSATHGRLPHPGRNRRVARPRTWRHARRSSTTPARRPRHPAGGRARRPWPPEGRAVRQVPVPDRDRRPAGRVGMTSLSSWYAAKAEPIGSDELAPCRCRADGPTRR